MFLYLKIKEKHWYQIMEDHQILPLLERCTNMTKTSITGVSVGWGKGITKQRNMHKRGGEILTTRVVNRMGVFK